MCFIDGANLVSRYQDLLKEGAKPNLESVKHMQDVYGGHPHFDGGDRSMVRLNYYTSAVDTDERIDEIRDEIGPRVINPAGYGRRVCPHVFKKLRSSTKAKVVHINLTNDALRPVDRDQVDCVFLFSGDGDFVPLVKEIMRNGKQVVIGALSSGINPEMRRIGDQFIDIDKWFFLRE